VELILERERGLTYTPRRESRLANSRLPAIYQAREFTAAGGLMSYGANLNDLFWLCASYVDKIRKGAKLSNLPVQQPTKFELVVKYENGKGTWA
jgi:ABC-type uncharacterized transport system substrate-binding protein